MREANDNNTHSWILMTILRDDPVEFHQTPDTLSPSILLIKLTTNDWAFNFKPFLASQYMYLQQ